MTNNAKRVPSTGLNSDLIRAAAEIGVEFRLARHEDRSKIGHHLACPDEYDLWDALASSARDNCGLPSIIWIHQVRTF